MQYKHNWVQYLSQLIVIFALLLPFQSSNSQTASDEVTATTAGSVTSESSASISRESSTTTDFEIQSRLEGILSELEQYEGVVISVSNSVVTLSGEVLSSKTIAGAETLATKVDGVASVDNQLTVETNVSERLDSSLEELATESRSVLTSLPLYALSVSILLGSWFLGRWVSQRRTLLNTVAPNAFIAELLGNLMWLLVVLVGVFVALRLLDATDLITTVLSAAGIVGLAVGFAVRDTVENYIASILLSIRNPFKTRDFIEVDGYQGSVARLTSRATVLISSDGNHIRIPNSVVYKSVIINYTRNPIRRFEFKVGIDSGDDIQAAQKLALETLRDVPAVLADPCPSIIVSELGESNTTLLIRGWIDQREHDLSKVRSVCIRRIKEVYDTAGIVMPEPIYRVVLTDSTQIASPIISDDTLSRTQVGSADDPIQDTRPERAVDATIDAELTATEEENLLSNISKHE